MCRLKDPNIKIMFKTFNCHLVAIRPEIYVGEQRQARLRGTRTVKPVGNR